MKRTSPIALAPALALTLTFLVPASPVHAQGSGSSFLQRVTMPSTGQVDMRIHDDGEIESVRLHTYRDKDGNTALWADLSNSPNPASRGIGLYIHAFPTREMLAEDDAISLSMRLPSLDLQCPCTPEEAGLRLYLDGDMEASLYRSLSPDVIVEKIERQRQGRVRLVGKFSADMAFYQRLDGPPDPTDTVRVEGRFDVVTDRM
ncbi:MAG: hypothetical protein JJU27_06470 [Gammaproteobacteria bacterium]|nr:hypothetical protein [Gammaproteobacteria bacterium]